MRSTKPFIKVKTGGAYDAEEKPKPQIAANTRLVELFLRVQRTPVGSFI